MVPPVRRLKLPAAKLRETSEAGVFAMSAITALVAQNTTGVREIVEMTPEFLGQQIDAVFEDIPPDAVKTGLGGSFDVRLAVDRHTGQDFCLRDVRAGCTLSSAIAANLAKGFDLPTSIRRSKDYLSGMPNTNGCSL